MAADGGAPAREAGGGLDAPRPPKLAEPRPRQPSRKAEHTQAEHTPGEREAAGARDGESKEIDLEHVRKLVAKVPGARLMQEGDKLEGQEEREEIEADWMRGQFDPCGDGIVTGLRIERGEGRSAEMATGPQPNEYDDLVITLRGSPTEEGEGSFYTSRAKELDLLSREESTWSLHLSDPNLMEHWANAFRAMSRGDWCRFTCAAKKGQRWLQNLVDSLMMARVHDGRPHESMPHIPPTGRAVCVEVRLDRWTEVKDVSKKKDKSLFKRRVERPFQTDEGDPSKDLDRKLQLVGEIRREDAEAIGEANEPPARRPTAPDRVRIRYEIRRLHLNLGWITVRSNGILRSRKQGEAEWVTMGGGMRDEKMWEIIEQGARRLEEGERALFSFRAAESWLPMRDAFGFQDAQAMKGAQCELDIKLEQLLKCTDVSARRDNSAAKFKIANGVGFWRPQKDYEVTVLVGETRSDSSHTSSPPKGSFEYTFSLFDGDGPWTALEGCIASMVLHESCLLTAPAIDLKPWPAAGPFSKSLPEAAPDGTLTLWLRLEKMARVELFAEGAVKKRTMNENEVEWMETMFKKLKELPMLDEDVGLQFAVQAEDLAGVTLFPEAVVSFRTGDMPLCEDWQLQIFHTVHHGENFKITCRAQHAISLIRGLEHLFAKQGQRPIDGPALAAHVETAGLSLNFQVITITPQPDRDGHSSAQLIGIIEDVKQRANALFEAGFVNGAMRKYVRATFLAQDGDEKEDPGAPMVQVVGIGSGKTRFAPEHKERITALRHSLHLNLAAGALKCKEYYGALAAADVAMKLKPDSIKSFYRKAQAHLALQEYVEAEEAISQLLRLEPQNSAARRLLADSKKARAEQAKRARSTFSGMFDRAQRSVEGALFSDDEISRQAKLEREKTRYVANRMEEKRRGVEVLDVKELSRLPEEYKQEQLDSLNEAIENEAQQSKVPEGLSEMQYRKLIQMRTDGVNEERVVEEMKKMQRAEQEETKKYMLPKERARMRERNEALIRDRYKSEEVVKQREQELWDEYKEIKERVDRRKMLLDAENRRQQQNMRECNEVLNNPHASEEEKDRALRKLVYDPFKDLDEFLNPDEREELDEIKFKNENDPRVLEKMQRLLLEVTSRRIEAKIDEMLEHENDVLV